ncbi:MAG: type IX secretion system outer membrane channel protein PorV [Chitinophagales bacterium]|nr:type IX secretion system outer membrane channel protein PorV [Chitinophagales bacterium]MCZ2392927.1 type IX secretion system outer membrane channel protein PorV [Chitinophagales bacterium]
MTKRFSLFIIILSSIHSFAYAQKSSSDVGRVNTVSTAVPFLRITPDARGGGMGDVGIATSPDASSTYYNASKLVFSEKKMGIVLSYTPWLKNLGISDIFLANAAGYYKIDDLQTVHASLRFFSLGNITFTDYLGNINGDYKPREFSFDAGYSRKLSDKFSLGTSIRYIHSNLAAGQEVNSTEVKAGKAVGVDLTTSYMQELKLKNNRKGIVSAGLAISNIGSKISYTDDALNKDFIPTNLGIGAGFRFFPNDYNEIAFYVDFNKLLVPTPDTTKDDKGNFLYKQKSPIAGIFSSFGDAPGGFKEEMKEIMYSIGMEYWYDQQFGIRAGYFNEHALKGNRKYFTAGVSVKYSVFGLDFSYLVPTSSQRNPLDNTFRFTLQFDFDKIGKKKYTEEELNEL